MNAAILDICALTIAVAYLAAYAIKHMAEDPPHGWLAPDPEEQARRLQATISAYTPRSIDQPRVVPFQRRAR